MIVEYLHLVAISSHDPIFPPSIYTSSVAFYYAAQNLQCSSSMLDIPDTSPPTVPLSKCTFTIYPFKISENLEPEYRNRILQNPDECPTSTMNIEN
jgi:hypothetical protein